MYVRYVSRSRFLPFYPILARPLSFSLPLARSLACVLVSRSRDRPNFRSVTREETSNTIVRGYDKPDATFVLNSRAGERGYSRGVVH